jgi:serine/threonine protein kinase
VANCSFDALACRWTSARHCALARVWQPHSALGVVLYELLTGSLPFTASEPMAWVHAHIAGRPVPPAERRQDIPDIVSAIVMKLLAKTAEDRYQTAAAVERDLRRCLAHSDAERRIDAFALAEDGTPDRLVIPETLRARARSTH